MDDSLTQPTMLDPALPPENRGPENRAQWEAQTSANFHQARNLARGVLDRLREKEAADAANKQAEADKLTQQKDRARTKVMTRVKGHEGIINKSFDSIKEIEAAMVVVEGCQGRLKQERYSRFADKTVTEKRIELRQKRPAGEAYRDTVQRALEQELNVLTAAREELLMMEMSAKALLQDLQGMRAELSKDTGSRRLAVHHDLSTLRPTPVAPGESTASKPAHSVIGSVAETLHQQALQVIKNSYLLKEKADKLIPRIREESRIVTKRVGDALAKHAKELADIKKQYEDHLKSVGHAIQEASRALAKEEDRLAMASDVETQQQIVTTLRGSVNELKATKGTLVEDLRSKVAALEIDNSCRRITPQIANEPPRPKLKDSASAPTLHGRVAFDSGATRGARATHTGFHPQGQNSPSAGSSFGSHGVADSEASTAATFGNQPLQTSPKTMGNAGYTAGDSSTLKAAAAAALA